MNSFNIYKKLFRRLMSQSVFYAPSELLVDGMQDMFDIQLIDYVDKLFYFTEDRISKPLENPEAFENIIGKRFQLEKTVAYLIKQKNAMDESSFAYIFEKYIIQVKVACCVSKLLWDNVENYFPNEPLVLYNTFLVQQNTMNEHKNELEKTFKIADSQPLQLEDLMKMSLMQNPDYLEMFSLEEITQPDLLQENATEAVALISDEEAEKFLLESVFSISNKNT